MMPVITTHSRETVNLVNPDPATLHPRDIAFALEYLNRYTGHVGAYSVADHSLAVAALVPARWRLEALLHDATEAYLGDVSSPLKRLLPEYRAIEARFAAAIAVRFGLDTSDECAAAVRRADLMMLRAEADRFGFLHLDAWVWVRNEVPVARAPWGPSSHRGALLDAIRSEIRERQTANANRRSPI